MADMSALEARILEFENKLMEMRDATREANAAIRDLRKERQEIERILGRGEIKQLVHARVEAVVKTELDKIGPEVKKQTQAIYEKVGQQIDKIIDLSLGKKFSTRKGREDIRPALAAHLRNWIREILDSEGYDTGSEA